MKDGDKTFIIVAGGMNKSAGPEYTNSVEIYDPSDNKWHSGKCKRKKIKLAIFRNNRL